MNDSKAPLALIEIQKWFGMHISRPIDVQSRMMEFSCSGVSLEKEAIKYIAPSSTLKPHQRLELYNQQYWWRLLDIMHEIFPLVTRLFGYTDFNMQIAMPYLSDYPPKHWSLAIIGAHLPEWIARSYKKKDKQLVFDAAMVDLAYNDIFYAAQEKPLCEQDINEASHDETTEKQFFLQPHVYLFDLQWDIFQWRKEFLMQEPEWWEDHDFPELEKNGPYYYVIGRSFDNNISYKRIEAIEYSILSLFKKGATLDNICLLLDHQDETTNAYAINNLQKWFQEWTVLQWLTTVPRTTLVDFYS